MQWTNPDKMVVRLSDQDGPEYGATGLHYMKKTDWIDVHEHILHAEEMLMESESDNDVYVLKAFEHLDKAKEIAFANIKPSDLE